MLGSGLDAELRTNIRFEMESERTTEACSSEMTSISQSVKWSDCSRYRQSQDISGIFTLALLSRSDAYFQRYAFSTHGQSLHFVPSHDTILNPPSGGKEIGTHAGTIFFIFGGWKETWKYEKRRLHFVLWLLLRTVRQDSENIQQYTMKHWISLLCWMQTLGKIVWIERENFARASSFYGDKLASLLHKFFIWW